MVNTGKASNACAVCKQRKIKCDLATPSCSQCIKSGWKCPGPKLENEITFKDQTDIIIYNLSRGRPSVKHSSGPSSQSNTPPQSLPRDVSPSLLERGTAFFMHYYVLQTDVGPNSIALQGHHEYLPALAQSDEPFGSLRMIIAAAGVAALSNTGNAASWAAESYRIYNEAIRQLQASLNDPRAARSDHSLAAIMLMGTFEAIASGDMASMKSYEKHALGAAQCIELRGPTQFRSRTSLKLFLEVRRVILTTCHQLQMTIPYAMDQWSLWAEQAQYPEESWSNRFAEINAQVATVRAQIKNSEMTEPSEITSELLAVDEQLLGWKRQLPESWSYTACQEPGASCLWKSRHDTYPDFWQAAAIWNSYRCVRLMIHEMIIKTNLAHEIVNQDDILQASAAVLREMADEICFSVPFVLGYCPSEQSHSRMFEPQTEPRPMPGGFVLMWPLFLSGMSRTTSWEQRDWIRGILAHVGLTMGVRLAMSMSAVLADKNKTRFGGESWLNGDFHP